MGSINNQITPREAYMIFNRNFILILSFSLLPYIKQAEALELDESFTGSTLSNPSDWILSYTGNPSTSPPCLTANSSNNIPLGGASSMSPCFPPQLDLPGFGALRLTALLNSQSGTMLYNKALPTANGLVIKFKIAEYGGGINAADGLSFYLKNGSNSNNKPGSIGAGLGYGPDNNYIDSTGVPGGLFGIGFDWYGNFSDTDLGFAGCDGPTSRVKMSVAIRGGDTSPNKDGTNGFCYINGTSADAVNYDTGDTRQKAGKQIKIVVDPSTIKNPKIFVFVAKLDETLPEVPTLIADQPQEYKDAETFKFGFSGSTGGLNNLHEVWDLSIDDAVADFGGAANHQCRFFGSCRKQ